MRLSSPKARPGRPLRRDGGPHPRECALRRRLGGRRSRSWTRGDCVGELALFDGGNPRSATATASEPTRTFIVTRAEFADWLKSRPAAALALLETLSGRLRRTDEALADLCFLDLPQRLAKQLVRLAVQNPGAAGAPAKVHVTQAEIAGLLSVSRESVNKQLNQFVRDGWISLGRGWVRVDDVAALRRFA